MPFQRNMDKIALVTIPLHVEDQFTPTKPHMIYLGPRMPFMELDQIKMSHSHDMK